MAKISLMNKIENFIHTTFLEINMKNVEYLVFCYIGFEPVSKMLVIVI